MAIIGIPIELAQRLRLKASDGSTLDLTPGIYIFKADQMVDDRGSVVHISDHHVVAEYLKPVGNSPADLAKRPQAVPDWLHPELRPGTPHGDVNALVGERFAEQSRQQYARAVAAASQAPATQNTRVATADNGSSGNNVPTSSTSSGGSGGGGSSSGATGGGSSPSSAQAGTSASSGMSPRPPGVSAATERSISEGGGSVGEYRDQVNRLNAQGLTTSEQNLKGMTQAPGAGSPTQRSGGTGSRGGSSSGPGVGKVVAGVAKAANRQLSPEGGIGKMMIGESDEVVAQRVPTLGMPDGDDEQGTINVQTEPLPPGLQKNRLAPDFDDTATADADNFGLTTVITPQNLTRNATVSTGNDCEDFHQKRGRYATTANADPLTQVPWQEIPMPKLRSPLPGGSDVVDVDLPGNTRVDDGDYNPPSPPNRPPHGRAQAGPDSDVGARSSMNDRRTVPVLPRL
jgi:hypothetical protein